LAVLQYNPALPNRIDVGQNEPEITEKGVIPCGHDYI
jgi:hypothetical protein